MYKVSITEQEAHAIGAERWAQQHRRRHTWLIFGLLAVSLLAVPLTGLTLPIWVPGSFLTTTLILAAALAFRFSRLSAKAGREFVQTLKKEANDE